MNRDGTIYFDTGGSSIQGGVALSVTSAGLAHPLVAGETFVGFSAESAFNSPSVLVSIEGFIELSVEGVTPAHVGSPVFARGSGNFTVDGKSQKASQIGRIVRAWSNGRALIKFSF